MKFIYRKGCSSCQDLRQAIQEMSLACDFTEVKDKQDQRVPQGKTLPLLIDDDNHIEGSEEIEKYLEQLKQFRNRWYKFQSDACYCDEQGNVE